MILTMKRQKERVRRVPKMWLTGLMGTNLKRIRERRNLGQGDLADKIGRAASTSISNYETGIRAIEPKMLEKFCKVLGAEPWEFFVTDITPIIKDDEELRIVLFLRKDLEMRKFILSFLNRLKM